MITKKDDEKESLHQPSKKKHKMNSEGLNGSLLEGDSVASIAPKAEEKEIVKDESGSLILKINDSIDTGDAQNESVDKLGAYLEERFNMYSNCIQNVLTTPKYRLIQLIYMLFRLTDNLSFLTLVVSSITGFVITEFDQKYFRVFTVVGVEIFYDVMNFTTNIWSLHRLNLWIGILLYVAYYIVFTELELPRTLWIIYWIRLASFVAESLTDYALDLELHNDLTNSDSDSDSDTNSTVFLCCFSINKDLKDLKETRKQYIGSISAWGMASAFSKKPSYSLKTCYCSTYFLECMIFLLIVLNIGTILLILVVGAIVTFLSYFVRTCFGETCCGELTYF